MSPAEDEHSPPWVVVLATLFAILLPEAIVVAAFSSMGAGIQVAEMAADSQIDMLGNAAGGICLLLLIFAFVIDLFTRPFYVQLPVGLIMACAFLAAASMKHVSLPWLSGLTCLGFTVVMIVIVRRRCFKPGQVSGRDFFNSLAASFVLGALIAIAAWVGWMAFTDRMWYEETRVWLAAENSAVYAYFYTNFTLDYPTYCSSETKNATLLSTFSDDGRAQIQSACSKSETVWFLQWSAPCAVGICNIILAAFSWVFAQATGGVDLRVGSEAVRVKKALKLCLALVILMIAIMYTAQYVSGANVTVSAGLVCLAAASLAGILGFMLLEFGFDKLNEVSTQDGLAKNLVSILKSDWMKAIAVGGLNVFIPIIALLDILRQAVRKCTRSTLSTDIFTVEGRRVVREMRTWAWCNIFFKVNMLGELFVALLLGMKLTYVFFSWLNETLAAMNLNFLILSLLVWGVGLAMFLCPIVPGSAVYLFAGVVCGAQSQLAGSIGFPAGVAVAAVVCSCAKLMACCLQYAMGYAAGQSVKVQQFVGVDKVPTRAMEQILKQDGLKIDKVAILVGGPDWPTSVLCGILRLRIPQMLLGTTPVIFVSIIPQCLVGALLTFTGDTSGIMPMVSSAVTLAAATVQASEMFFFSYRIMKVVEVDGEKLAQPRPEHEAVAELTRKEAAYVAALKETCNWSNMGCLQKLMVLFSSLCLLLAGFVLAADYSLGDQFCFRSFSITSKIGDPFELGGLDGQALNLVVVPAGWAALGLAFLGFFTHIIVSKWLACAARARLLKAPQPEQPSSTTIGKVNYDAFKGQE